MSDYYPHRRPPDCNRHGGFIEIETPGLQGPKGDPGEKGEPGVSPDMSVAVKTLPPGSEATVSKSGTQSQPLFTIGVPRGDKGEKGETGNLPEIPEVSVGDIDNLF